MSKKILSLALAVMMLFSVCAVAANAAVADGATIGIRVVSDAQVGAAAGTTVNVSVIYDLPEGVDEYQLQNHNLSIGWNSAKYKLDTTSTTNANDARTWGDAYSSYFKSTAAVTISATLVNKIVALFNDSDTANGWDTACQVQQTYDTATTSASYGYPCSSGEVLVSLRFVTQDTITADDVIGIVQGAYGQTYCRVTYFDGTTTPVALDASAVDMTEAVAVPAAASYDVYKLADSRKHLADDSTYTTASFFAFNSIAPDFNDAGTSQFITAITATVTATSGDTSITVTPDAIKYVYDLGSGEYGFRVICKGLPADAAVSIVPAVTTTDGATYSVETISFNVADLTAY